MDTLSRALPPIYGQCGIHRPCPSFDCLPDESDQSIHRLAGLDRFLRPPTVPVITVPGTTRCTTPGTVHATDTPPSNRWGAAWKPGALGGCGASRRSTGRCKAAHGVSVNFFHHPRSRRWRQWPAARVALWSSTRFDACPALRWIGGGFHMTGCRERIIADSCSDQRAQSIGLKAAIESFLIQRQRCAE